MRIVASSLWLAAGLIGAAGCAPYASTAGPEGSSPAAATASGPAAATEAATSGASAAARARTAASGTDPRVGLSAGLLDAGEATWNLRVVSETPPPTEFVGSINSDLAFTGPYAIQGNFKGFQIWDISDPAHPALVKVYVCPASQSDVSVYENLLFVSGEGLEGRLDCGTEGVERTASPDRLRGIRIFDISDIRNPRYIADVQTCRGSHTHSVLVDPDDPENVYIYVSGSASVRPAEELPGCSGAPPEEDPNTALFRIEVIRVPLAHPEEAAIVSSPRIFGGLAAPARHGAGPEDVAEIARAKARGAFIMEMNGQEMVLPDAMVDPMLEDVVQARGGSGAPTAADSAALRRQLPQMAARRARDRRGNATGPRPGPTQCHDITVYPEIGLAGGACEGYGFLIDISDPVHPKRIAAVADSNFSYWHSATLNNDGSAILFSDEWGGGMQAKCRPNDPKEWGADAIFTIERGGERASRGLRFRSYYKLPAPQTSEENCVAHNGSMIPIPGRDVMVQAWYQGGVSVFDWTDPAHPIEIAFFDRGPVDASRMEGAGSWSAYWYNGMILSSELVRGLDILELTPSEFLSANEIEAARSVRFDQFNVQGQQKFVWPPTFVLARAYLDQLERSSGLAADRIADTRRELARAEATTDAARRHVLTRLAARLESETDARAAAVEAGAEAGGSHVRDTLQLLVRAVRDLAVETGSR